MLRVKDKKFGGVLAKMQEQKPCEGQAINIVLMLDKVYDWIVKEKSFEISPTGPIAFPGVTAATVFRGAAVTCDVSPAPSNPIVILREDLDLHLMKNAYRSVTFRRLSFVKIILTFPNG